MKYSGSLQPPLLMHARTRTRPAETGAAQSQRRWCDGSLEQDLPMHSLSQLFGANCFLVSQCNPYLLPFISLKELLPARLARLVESEFKHRCKQLLALWPDSWLLTMLSQPWEGDITMVLPSSGAGAGRGRRTDGHRAAS